MRRTSKLKSSKLNLHERIQAFDEAPPNDFVIDPHSAPPVHSSVNASDDLLLLRPTHVQYAPIAPTR